MAAARLFEEDGRFSPRASRSKSLKVVVLVVLVVVVLETLCKNAFIQLHTARFYCK